jgi:hypothetical protein
MGQFVIFENFEGPICNFEKKMRGPFITFYKFIGVNLQILKNMRTKRHKNEEI